MTDVQNNAEYYCEQLKNAKAEYLSKRCSNGIRIFILQDDTRTPRKFEIIEQKFAVNHIEEPTFCEEADCFPTVPWFLMGKYTEEDNADS
ncbi:hypothetical protein TNCV_4696691 [Trichonephila clavipes]|nr:hypothetical protein TNCV_4696691 [Trichonephila clavipes]